jgi:diguanylate cyclase (GGDEF)-like protein/putative nucleotidyltransferase with HDIG domain
MGRVEARYALALAAPVALAAICAGASCFARIRTGVPQWSALGAGAVLYGLADGFGAAGHTGRFAPGAALALSAIGFTLANLLFLISLLWFAGAPRIRLVRVAAADVALVLASCVAVAWCVVLGPIATIGSLPFHVPHFEVIYVVEDALMVLASVVLVHQVGGQCQPLRSAGHLATAIVLIVVGDVVDCCAIKMLWGGGFTLAGALWAIGMLQLLLGILEAEAPVEAPAQVPTTRVEPAWSFAATVVTVGSTLLILLCEVAAHGFVGPVSLSVAGALMAAYLARQWAAMFQSSRLLRQNVAYSNRLRGFNSELEETVERRTRYLRAVHSIAAATRATLDESEVLDLCLKGTVDALRAEGGCIFVDGRDEPSCVAGNAAPLPSIAERVSQWRTDRLAPELEPGLYSLLGIAGSKAEPLALIVVWRHTYDFTDEDNELIDSVGMELEAALHNARVHEEAAAAADRDPLTGLLNHRAMHQRLATEISRSRRDGRPLAAMMLDLNDFKIFNDTFGHPVGDEVLRHVASTLLACIRDFDLAGRYGGDEFVLVLPGADRDTAAQIGERIRSSLYEGGFESEAGETPLRITYGLAVCPDDAINRKDLLALADADLYRAKQHRGPDIGDGVDLRSGLVGIPAFAALDALVTSLDQRDRYTRRHSEDVTRYALAMAEALGWSGDDLQAVRIAALLHDMGKVGVPEHLLRKPGSFTHEETEAMQRHPEVGYVLARPLDAGTPVEDGIRYHHERWDGRGYPGRLSRMEIPPIARLLAVADAFSAMTTHRPYRRALEPDEALQTLRNGAGSQWDPAMVETFIHARQTMAPPADLRDARSPHQHDAPALPSPSAAR